MRPGVAVFTASAGPWARTSATGLTVLSYWRKSHLTDQGTEKMAEAGSAGKPAKGKKYTARVNGKKVSYGAKGYTIAPGTKRGDSYCARSYGIAQEHASARKPDSPNYLSRKKWKCRGKKSMR